MWGKQVCVIKKGLKGQRLQQTSLISDNVEEMIQEYCEIKQNNAALKLGISKRKSGPHYQSTWILKSLSHEN